MADRGFTKLAKGGNTGECIKEDFAMGATALIYNAHVASKSSLFCALYFDSVT